MGQIAQSILSVRNYSPNWQQFAHVRHKIIFKLIFKKLPKLEKSLAPSFSNQKRNIGSRQWLNKLMDLNNKILTLNQKENI